MITILQTPAAENDLINIWLYIADDNPTAADRVLNAAKETFEIIADNPKVGKVFQSKRAKLKGIRFFQINKFPKYIVYYKPFEKGFEIIRVLHGFMQKDDRLES